MSRAWIAACLVCSGAACSDPAPVSAPRVSAPTVEAPSVVAPVAAPAPIVLAAPAGGAEEIDSLAAIQTDEDWRRLAAASDEHAIARVEVVKVLLDLATDRLLFLQSVRWPLHYEFALHAFPDRALGDRGTFNTRNYLRADREMILGTVAHYLESDVWALELGPADTLSGERIASFHARIAAALHHPDALRFHPRSDVHERSIADVRALPIVRADALWHGVQYQALTPGTAYGRLRFVESAAALEEVAPSDIVVLRDGPDALPLVSGMIVSALQGPLSHVAVLSHGRGTPAMGRPGAFEDPALRALEGALVRLDVERGAFRIGVVSIEDAERAWAASRPTTSPTIALDLSVRALRTLDEITLADAAAFGAKAAQLAEASRVLRDPEPVAARTLPGVVVPVSRFTDHLARALEGHPWRGAVPSDGSGRERALADVRDRIMRTPIDPVLVAEVIAALGRLGGSHWLFRSSTNAEDLEGFSGAGLYDSVTVDDAAPDSVAHALAEVYASVFSRRAFEERDWYRIDHDRVAMAVLIQPFATDAIAFGVAITRNPFSSVRSGHLVDVQVRGGSVTATADDLPEEILLHRHSRAELVRRSTRTDAPIFRPGELLSLRAVLDRLHDRFIAHWADPTLACDVELALLADRSIAILQVRPYR